MRLANVLGLGLATLGVQACASLGGMQEPSVDDCTLVGTVMEHQGREGRDPKFLVHAGTVDTRHFLLSHRSDARVYLRRCDGRNDFPGARVTWIAPDPIHPATLMRLPFHAKGRIARWSGSATCMQALSIPWLDHPMDAGASKTTARPSG